MTIVSGLSVIDNQRHGMKKRANLPLKKGRNHPGEESARTRSQSSVMSIFGIAGAGDVDHYRQLIKVLQELSRDMNQDVGQPNEAMEMITSITTHLAVMEEYIKKKQLGTEILNYMELTDDAL